MPRTLLRIVSVVSLAAALSLSAVARANEVVSIATLAPKQSVWGQVFSVWQKAVEKKSDGKLELKIFWNAQQGDDGAAVGKMRAGQLDGATVSALGLSKIHKPILALQIPGIFRDWAGLDRARDALRSEFEKGALQEGFIIGGWGDIGRLRSMSRGFAVRSPSDLKGKNVLTWRDDTIGPTLVQLIEGAVPVPLSPPEVLPALNTSKLDAFSAPALAAEQLQWGARVDHIGAESSVMAIGAMVWSKKRLDALPGDLRTMMEDTGKVASRALAGKIRAEDDAAFSRLGKKMTVVTLSESDRKAWKVVFDKTRTRLTQGTFSKDLVDRLVKLGQTP